jgi:hypothetical protein
VLEAHHPDRVADGPESKLARAVDEEADGREEDMLPSPPSVWPGPDPALAIAAIYGISL